MAAPGSHLTCDATQHPSPSPAGIQECAKSHWPGQVGLYIGSMCNREGCLLFLLPPSHPLSGEGEKVFLRQSTGTTNKVVTLPLSSDLSPAGCGPFPACVLRLSDLDGVQWVVRHMPPGVGRAPAKVSSWSRGPR